MVKDINLKILSVVISIALWFFVATSEFVETNVYVPVDVVHHRNGYVAVADQNFVNILIKGPQPVIKNIAYGDVRILMDVTGMKPGETSRQIRFEDVKVPAGVEIIKISPQQLNVTVDTFIKRKVNVAPTFIGEPMLGYKVDRVEVTPERVEIEGARSKLDGVVSIDTLPVNISEKRESITYKIALKKIEGIKAVDPEQVEVAVHFTEDVIEKKVSGMMLRLEGLPLSLALSKPLPNITAVVKGRPDHVEKVHENMELYLNAADIDKPGVYTREVLYKTETGTKVVKTTPRKVKFRVIKRN